MISEDNEGIRHGPAGDTAPAASGASPPYPAAPPHVPWRAAAAGRRLRQDTMTAPTEHAEHARRSSRRPHGLRDLRRLVRYGISGSTAAAVHLGVLTVLVEVAGLRPVVASAIGFLCGFVVSYLLQRRWVFATDLTHGFTLPRFVVVIGLGLLINTAVLWLGTEYLEHHYALVQLAAFVVVPLNNYVLNSLWTFR